MGAWETKEKDDAKNVEYYYKREERLAKAGPYARFAAGLHGKKRQGLLKTMTATKPLAFLFYTLLFAMVASLLVNWISGGSPKATLGGYSYALDALWFEGDVYLTVKRSRSRGAERPGSVEVKLTVGGEIGQGALNPGESELKLRLPAAARPEWAVAVVSLGDDGVELSSRVR